jgi:hypothetical protein|tara:strand:+ start:626 stop:820 length:195 start_codon:yes stop_codon:yes gene_type:complete
MDIIDITCIDNGKVKEAEVLARSDKYLKVVFVGTQITIELVRSDVNRPYIGNKSGLEFTWQEKN